MRIGVYAQRTFFLLRTLIFEIHLADYFQILLVGRTALVGQIRDSLVRKNRTRSLLLLRSDGRPTTDPALVLTSEDCALGRRGFVH